MERNYVIVTLCIKTPHTALGGGHVELHRASTVAEAAAVHLRVVQLESVLLQSLVVDGIGRADYDRRLAWSQRVRGILAPLRRTCSITHTHTHTHTNLTALFPGLPG